MVDGYDSIGQWIYPLVTGAQELPLPALLEAIIGAYLTEPEPVE